LGRFPSHRSHDTRLTAPPKFEARSPYIPDPEGISDETLDRSQPASPTTPPSPFNAAPRHLCHHYQPTALVTILINLSLALRPEISFIMPQKYASQRHTVGNDLGLDAARVHPHTPDYVIYIRCDISVSSIFTISRAYVVQPPCKDLSLAENGVLKGQSKFRFSEEVPSLVYLCESQHGSIFLCHNSTDNTHSLFDLGFIPGAQCSIFNKRAEG